MLRADKVYKALNGVFCAYKQPGLDPVTFQDNILRNVFKSKHNYDSETFKLRMSILHAICLSKQSFKCFAYIAFNCLNRFRSE